MRKFWSKTAGLVLASVALLSACGGGGGETASTPLAPFCNPGTAFVGLSYPNTSSAANAGLAVSPTLTGLSAACASSSASYSLASGPLPTGVSLNASTGVISGTPTVQGSFPFSVKVVVAGYTGSVTSQLRTITITPPPPAPVVWTPKTTNFGAGTALTLSSYKVATIGNNLHLVVSNLNSSTSKYVVSHRRSTDGGATWVDDAILLAGFSLRNFALVSDGTSLYVIGGSDSDAAASQTYSNKVWKHTPGTTASTAGVWTAVTSTLWTTGGREEVAAAYNGAGKLFVYGGYGAGGIFNGVLSSDNGGLNWTPAPQDTTSYNLTQNCLVANGATLYSFGGDGNAPGSTDFMEQKIIQKSTDSGSTWTVINSTAINSPIRGSCAAIGTKPYYAGGSSTDTSGVSFVSRAVLQSGNNGTTWFTDAFSTVFSFRDFHGMTVLANKLIVLGGYGDNTTPRRTDVIEGTPSP